ncbi:sulfotransferase ssu-1-like [Rhipicephalus sanguineus]|uniref:sulfotransferase ssu-1-like n=1 Tax=Rhipicephalus sanguineus TaxID=34632 RepID=UPI001892FD3D|nr:sulfotransferase ssu-1-like [Rhipicephalus sanguineus]
MDEESYRFVEGVCIHNFFQEDGIRSAVKYKPRAGDIFVVTYPKCGTNWMQFIVYNILTRAEPISNLGEFRLKSPFIELLGAAAAENPSRNGPIKTHLPFNVFRPVERAKYIYVARNPYDCAVSYYHFIKGFTPKTVTDVSFEKFLSLYLAGKVIYGDYFNHLLPLYELRKAVNVHSSHTND